MTDAKLTAWIDAYFDARPHLQRPSKTMTGYDLGEWKSIVESLFALVDIAVIEAALVDDDDDGLSAMDRTIERDMADTDVDLYGKAMNAISERVDEVVLERTGVESSVVYSAYETNSLGYPIDNLDEVAFEGTFLVCAEYDAFWERSPESEHIGRPYVNKEPLVNPTWLDLAVEADKAIKTTHDTHHIFFEGATEKKPQVVGHGHTTFPVKVLQLFFGS